MRKGFGRNKRGEGFFDKFFEFFGWIFGILGTLVSLGLIAFVILIILAYFVDIPMLRGTSSYMHNFFDKTPIGPAIKATTDMFTTAIYNPTSMGEAEVKTEGSTQTSAAIGMKLNDPPSRTGILSGNPVSEQKYTIEVGVYNPTKDFIAKGSNLALGNPTEMKRTELSFDGAKFEWNVEPKAETTDILPRGCAGSYASATITSTDTNGAKKVTKLEEVAPTNILMEVDYAYDFQTTHLMDVGGGKPEGALTMYHAKLIVSSQQEASKIDKYKDLFKIKDYAAGGPVVVARKDNQPYIDPAQPIRMSFIIRNADANSGVLEAVDFKDPTKLVILAPDEFDATTDGNMACSQITIKDANDKPVKVKKCTITKLFGSSNWESMKNIGCTPDGCPFNKYEAAQGFDANSHILTDEPGTNEREFSVSFKFVGDAKDETVKNKVYSVYLVFLDRAYTYHAAMKQPIAVQVG